MAATYSQEVHGIPGLSRDLMTAVQELLQRASLEEAELYLSYLVWPPGVEPPDPRVLARLAANAPDEAGGDRMPEDANPCR